MTELPGSKAQHSIITDECRANRSDDGALDEAVTRLRKAFADVAAGWPVGKGATVHVALTVERPAKAQGPADAAAALITEAAERVRQAAITLSGTGWGGELSAVASELHDWSRRVAAADL